MMLMRWPSLHNISTRLHAYIVPTVEATLISREPSPLKVLELVLDGPSLSIDVSNAYLPQAAGHSGNAGLHTHIGRGICCQCTALTLMWDAMENLATLQKRFASKSSSCSPVTFSQECMLEIFSMETYIAQLVQDLRPECAM